MVRFNNVYYLFRMASSTGIRLYRRSRTPLSLCSKLSCTHLEGKLRVTGNRCLLWLINTPTVAWQGKLRDFWFPDNICRTSAFLG